MFYFPNCVRKYRESWGEEKRHFAILGCQLAFSGDNLALCHGNAAKHVTAPFPYIRGDDDHETS